MNAVTWIIIAIVVIIVIALIAGAISLIIYFVNKEDEAPESKRVVYLPRRY